MAHHRHHREQRGSVTALPSQSASAVEGPGQPGRRGALYDALVGRRLDRGSSIILAVLNLVGFAGYGLVFLFYLLGAAMAAGTTTQAMDRWINGMLWSLGVGAAACLYTAILLAAGHRWPRAVQWLPVIMLLAVVLLNVFAPSGINSPRRGV